MFIDAIHKNLKVEIKYQSKEKGLITRQCIPFDYGPSQRANIKDKRDKYHFLDLNSPKGMHLIAGDPERVLEVKQLNESFDPGQYITWDTNWTIPRDWGIFS
jgi:hypothetical protein